MVDTINSAQSNDNQPNLAGNHFYSGFNRPDEVKVNLAKEQKDFPSSEGPRVVGENKPIEPVGHPTLPSEPPKPIEPVGQPTMRGNAPELIEPAPNTVVTSSPTPQPEVTPNPVQEPVSGIPKVSDLEAKPQTIHHTAYSAAKAREPILWRNVLIVFAGGIVTAVIVSAAMYFVISYINTNKINEQKTTLNDLNNELNNLKQQPTPLELPVTTPPSSAAASASETTNKEAVEQPTIETPVPAATSNEQKG